MTHGEASGATAALRLTAPLRILLGGLGAIDVATGIWAVIDPRGWYRSYPGLGHHWLVSQGPFNAHLVTDTGSGFLAIGLVAAFAGAAGMRSASRVAALALFAHSLPHFLYHVLNPDRALHGLDVLAGTWGLLVETVIAAVVLLAATRGSAAASPTPAGGGGR